MDNITNFVGKDNTIMTFALATSVDSATEQLAKLNNDKTAIEGVMSAITSEITDYITNKAATLGGTLTTFGKFGTQNAGEWMIDITEPMTLSSPLSAMAPSAFSCPGNFTLQFPTYNIIICNNGIDGYSRCYVRGSSYDGLFTTVLVGGGVVTSHLTGIRRITGTYAAGYKFLDNASLHDTVTYVSASAFSPSSTHNIPVALTVQTDYGTTMVTSVGSTCDVTPANLAAGLSYVKLPTGSLWDDDVNITKWISDFDFAYDHLYHPLGASGTYGIVARIAAMTAGMATINNNKSQQDAIDGVYRAYTQWTQILSGGELEYVDETSFLVPGDMTSTFPVSADLLIDCGVDKQKGCAVLSSEYIPLSAADYTECTIVANISAYTYDPEFSSIPTSAMNIAFENTLLSINISGGPAVSGAVFNDVVSFLCPGDQTSLLVAGTSLRCEFDDEDFPSRFFLVYAVEHLSDSRADKTLIKITDGLPITENIDALSIVVEE